MSRLIGVTITVLATIGLMMSPALAQTVGKNVISVGPGKEYASLWPAVKKSRAGDVIQVYGGGTEQFGDLQITHNLTIESVGGNATLLAPSKKTAGGNVAKGILIIGSARTEPTVTIKGFVFSGAKSSNSNGSGVRYQSGNLTLIDDTFTKNENGVLGNPFAVDTGTIVMRGCTFDRNGAGDGQSHNIYIGEVNEFTLENSVSAHASVGHEVKSRAVHNTIVNNRIFEGNGSAAFPGNGTASYSIDLPNGGDSIVRGNTIEKGPKSQGTLAIHFGGFALMNPDSRLIVQDNTIINDGSPNNVVISNQSLYPVELIGNKIENFGTNRVLEGIGSAKGNRDASGTPMKDFVSNYFGKPANTIDFRGTSQPQTLVMSKKEQTVEGGNGLLTVATTKAYQNVIGGPGGIDLKANWGPLFVFTMRGTANNLLMNNTANGLFSAGKDTIRIAKNVGNPFINITGTTTITEDAQVSGTRYWVGQGGKLTLETTTGGSHMFHVRPNGTLTINGPAGYSGEETAGSFTHNARKFGFTIAGGAASFSTGDSVNISTYGMDKGATRPTITLGAGKFMISAAGGATIHGGSGHVSVTNGSFELNFIGGSGTSWISRGTGPTHIVEGSGKMTVTGGRSKGDPVYEVDAAVGGGEMTIDGFEQQNDKLVFKGFDGNPVSSQVVANGALTITLVNWAKIVLPGISKPLPNPRF